MKNSLYRKVPKKFEKLLKSEGITHRSVGKANYYSSYKSNKRKRILFKRKAGASMMQNQCGSTYQTTHICNIPNRDGHLLQLES